MHIVTILSQKGGVGKTTLTSNLGVVAAQQGLNVCLIDLDPQASLSLWSDSRIQSNINPHIDVTSVQGARLQQAVAQMRTQNKYDLILIDTPPSVSNENLFAAKVADICVVPTQPSILDIRAIENSIRICELANVPAYAVINSATGNAKGHADDAKEALGHDIEALGTVVNNRIAFKHAMAASLGVLEYEPSSKAADEISSLWNEIVELLEGGRHVKKVS